MTEVTWLKDQIEQWFETTDNTNKTEWHDAFGLLTEVLETTNDLVTLPDGKVVTYWTNDFLQGSTEEQLFVFKVDGETYALRGWADSWESEWDSGPFKVEERPVTVDQWFITE